MESLWRFYRLDIVNRERLYGIRRLCGFCRSLALYENYEGWIECAECGGI